MKNFFTWMFKHDNFIPHVKQMLILGIIFYVSGGVLMLFSGTLTEVSRIAAMVLCVILFVCPNLLLSGYYWNLTENIIDRRVEVQATSVYNGKINTTEEFDLPEFDVIKFLWRGFAGSLAVLIAFLPCVLFAVLQMILSHSCSATFLFNRVSFMLILLILVFLPALMWNYAKRDSIIATLNIRKAIYIVGNYPFRYAWNVFLMLVIFGLVTLLSSAIYSLTQTIFGNEIIARIISTIPVFICNLYTLFVIAYLHGTITPTGEGA